MARVFLVDLEAVETRYTGQWKTHVPELLRSHGHDVTVIQGPTDIPSATTPGAFLNFGGTNVYKARQVEEMGRLFTQGDVSAAAHFIFTDAWHPGIINLKYMSELLGIPVKIHALWHAGSYDPQDFLGRLIGDTPWVRHAEKSFYHCVDYNYFATDFHIEMFVRNLLNNGMELENPWFDEDLQDILEGRVSKIVRTGWPMEYMPKTLEFFGGANKRNLVLFPHRKAPEKQLDIFLDMAKSIPNAEFMVCQEQSLTKDQYHSLLAEAKVVFSANLQETLGISMYEGALLGAIPMVPDRLSYREMYADAWRYPSIWTESYDSYRGHRQDVVDRLTDYLDNYHSYSQKLTEQTNSLTKNYFSADKLLENIF